VKPAFREFKEIKVKSVLLVFKDHKELKETLEPREIPVHMDLQD
jgi:hypothetical protein